MAVAVSVLEAGAGRQGKANLTRFRRGWYDCLSRRADALFELTDALLATGPVTSLPYLSLDELHRRGHGSTYAALANGRVGAEAARELFADSLPRASSPVFAVDVSVWVRSDAECSPGRGYYYHPSRHSAGQPIVAGWAYPWLVGLELTTNSWTAPVDARRLVPGENPSTVAACQIIDLLRRRPELDRQTPLFVFDGGYDSVRLALELTAVPAQILVRVRSDRSFYADPPPQRRTTAGRPRRHGAKFACPDPTTWPAPDAIHSCTDEQYGAVTVKMWHRLHAKTQQHDGHGSRGPRPIIPGTLVQLTVDRLPGRTRAPKTLWLWWTGPPGHTPDPDLLWRAYTRRFDIEHTFRFARQTLNWTLPRPHTPEQADRWTWLIIAAYTQLRLARALVADHRLPWEKPLPPARLTPGRVRRRFRHVQAAVGTPANPPQPCGRSAGRPQGTRRGPAPRHPAVKTAARPATRHPQG
ncbi:NF041680 family putative transposase [Streptomyces sp. NPDC002671]